MSETPKTPEISDALLEQLLKDYQNPEDLLGPDGLMKELKKRLIEKALGAELTAHLGYEKSDPQGRGSGNSRNGARRKTVKSEDGAVEIHVPRDRAGSFRTAAREEGPDADRRLRRQDRLDVCARDVGPRNPGASEKPLRR
jgi:transposase-like protein